MSRVINLIERINSLQILRSQYFCPRSGLQWILSLRSLFRYTKEKHLLNLFGNIHLPSILFEVLGFDRLSMNSPNSMNSTKSMMHKLGSI